MTSSRGDTRILDELLEISDGFFRLVEAVRREHSGHLAASFAVNYCAVCAALAPFVDKTATGSSAADVDGAEQSLGRHESVGERQGRQPVVDVPPHLAERSEHWLEANKKTPDQVRWGSFPLGMVQRWIERAEEAEAELSALAELEESS